MDDDDIIRMKQLVKKVGLCRATLYNMVKKNEFPRQLRIGRRATGWRRSDVLAWMEQRERSSSVEHQP